MTLNLVTNVWCHLIYLRKVKNIQKNKRSDRDQSHKINHIAVHPLSLESNFENLSKTPTFGKCHRGSQVQFFPYTEIAQG